MKPSIFSKLQFYAYMTVGILAVILFVYLGINENVDRWNETQHSGITVLQDVAYSEAENTDAPLGVAEQYRFTLNEELHECMSLAFYISHAEVSISVDGKEIYTLKKSPEIGAVKTTGSNWHMVSLDHEYMEKEFLVEIYPLYDDFNTNVKFIVGHPLEIYRQQLQNAFPDMFFSSLNIIVGIIFLGFGLKNYLLKNGKKSGLLFALGGLALASGLWRITDTRFSPFMVESRPSMIYAVSILMLALMPIFIIQSSHRDRKSKAYGICAVISIAIAVVNMILLLLQIGGIADLRENLTIIHGMLLIGAGTIIIETIIYLIHKRKKKALKKEHSAVWIIAVGILADMVIFFVGGASFGLLCTIIAMLGYVIIEGIRIQRNQTREKQLMAARIEQLTSVDSLTGIKNRDSYMQDLKEIEKILLQRSEWLWLPSTE